jgi:hypothetical protein
VVADVLHRRRGVDAVRRQAAVFLAHDVRVLPLDLGELLVADAARAFRGSLELLVGDGAKGTVNEVTRHAASLPAVVVLC